MYGKGPLRAKGLVLTGSPLLSLSLVGLHNVFKYGQLFQTHTDTQKNSEWPEVGRSGAER